MLAERSRCWLGQNWLVDAGFVLFLIQDFRESLASVKMAKTAPKEKQELLESQAPQVAEDLRVHLASVTPRTALDLSLFTSWAGKNPSALRAREPERNLHPFSPSSPPSSSSSDLIKRLRCPAAAWRLFISVTCTYTRIKKRRQAFSIIFLTEQMWIHG